MTDDEPQLDDVAAVTELLGRPPQGDFEVVVRDGTGRPVVIRNAPLLGDGTPMPTRYWLVDAELRRRVSGLESTGGGRAAEAAIDPDELARAHARHAGERETRHSRRPHRAPTVGRRCRHPPRGQVPPRPLRLAPGRRRRPRRTWVADRLAEGEA